MFWKSYCICYLAFIVQKSYASECCCGLIVCTLVSSIYLLYFILGNSKWSYLPYDRIVYISLKNGPVSWTYLACTRLVRLSTMEVLRCTFIKLSRRIENLLMLSSTDPRVWIRYRCEMINRRRLFLLSLWSQLCFCIFILTTSLIQALGT